MAINFSSFREFSTQADEMGFKARGRTDMTKVRGSSREAEHQAESVEASLPSVVVTSHAIRRAQLRGIPIAGVSMAAKYGQIERVSGGSVIRMLTPKALARAMQYEQVSPALEGRLSGTAVITKDSGDVRTVITVLPKETRGGLREVRRRQKAYGRKHASRRMK